jgi:hypothetical protein
MRIQPRRQLVILVLGLSFSCVSVGCSSAPPPMHPWFTEHFTIGPGHLPEGVSADIVPNTTYNYPAEYLVITNNSETFLYLSAIESPYTVPTGPQFVAPPVQLHSDGIPAFRIASGKAYVWDVVSREPPWQLGWEPVDKYGPSDSVRLYISGNSLTAQAYGNFTYYLAEYEWHNKFDYGGARPADVKLPAPHGIMLPIDYGDEEIVLPISISYTLNEHYPARAIFAPEWVNVAVGTLVTLWPVTIVVVVLLIALVIFVVNLSRKRQGGS